MQDSYNFVFFGIAGSGKGTQVKLLEEFLKKHDGKDVVFVSTGEQFRKIITSTSQASSVIQNILEKGALVPDFFTDAIFSNILINEISPDKNLITDGYPRTVSQSKFFEDTLKFYSRENVKIIYIELSEAEAVKRMKLRGRTDDTDEGIKKRFDEYVKNVLPSFDYFKDKEGYEILTINGEQSIEDVHKDIIKALNL